MFKHPTGKHPESVNILALGPTNADYHGAHFSYEPIIPEADEVWTMNKGIRTQKHDLCFILDDLVGETEPWPRYRKDINESDSPIITSIIDADVRRLVPDADLHLWPHWEIIDFWGEIVLLHRARNARRRRLLVDAGENHPDAPLWTTAQVDPVPGCNEAFDNESFDKSLEWTERQRRDTGKQVAGYMKNSIPMVLAYAGAIGVQVINLFGADYDFPGSAVHEADKPNAEYWAAMLKGTLGISIRVSQRTTLFSTNQGPSIYGFGARQPVDILT